MRSVVICDLGRVDYVPTWELQRQIQERLIEAKRRVPPRVMPHVFLLVEHPPVFTLGKNGDISNLLLSESELRLRGATFHRIDRGGDITYHGPGQLVGYPILDLEHFFTDIHRYLRGLEETIILSCADFGVSALRVEGRTGVWVGPDEKGFERKICALGIRSSRWVTMHGFAFNLNTDLSYFSFIHPCGITDRDVTSLEKELGRRINEQEVKARVVQHFAERFEADIEVFRNDESRSFLSQYLGAEVVT